MTTSEIIHVYQHSRLQSESFTPEAITAAYVAGLAALQEQSEQENPEPLTKMELQQLSKDRSGTPVWVVPLSSRKGHPAEPEWAVVEPESGNAYIPGIEYTWWELEGYGEKWIAYLHKPK